MKRNMNESSLIEADNCGFPDILREKYACLSCLRWNDQEMTWLCEEHGTGEQVLVKVASEPGSFQRLRNEAEILAVIAAARHPSANSFPKSKELIFLEGSPYRLAMVRSYVPGHSLESLVESQPSQPGLPREKSLRYLMEILDQLDFLHHLNPPVIHRDVKPQNVIVDAEDHCHLIDLDIARMQREPGDSDTLVMGTRLTSPPEQFGFRTTDARSDVYSAGVLLRFCLTGEYREEADQTLPPDIRRAVQKATRFDPINRYQQAAEFRKDLRRLLASDGGRKKQICLKRTVLALIILILPAVAFWLYGFFSGTEVPDLRNESPMKITADLFGGDSDLYSEFVRGEFGNCSAAILPEGMRFVRYAEFTESLPEKFEGEPALLSAEELISYLRMLQDSDFWPKMSNLLIVHRNLTSLKPFATDYQAGYICLEFHGCILPSDPEPLRALMPSCYELACYEGTTVSWSSLDFLRDAAHLDVLSLPFDGKTAADLSALSSVPSLRILRLSDVPVSEKILAEIGRMEKLEILWLPGCGITDVSPLAGLKNLEELNLQNNEIRDDPEPDTK